jgi:hypothetical protein
VKGLNPNIEIATSGFDRLENGAQVQIRTPGKGKGKSQDSSDTNSKGNSQQ